MNLIDLVFYATLGFIFLVLIYVVIAEKYGEDK